MLSAPGTDTLLLSTQHCWRCGRAQVGDQSDFVTGFSRTLAEAAPRLGPALSPLHFRYFCDKLAASLCPRYYEYIFRCAHLIRLHSTPHD